jgi:hypothetical protein
MEKSIIFGIPKRPQFFLLLLTFLPLTLSIALLFTSISFNVSWKESLDGALFTFIIFSPLSLPIIPELIPKIIIFPSKRMIKLRLPLKYLTIHASDIETWNIQKIKVTTIRDMGIGSNIISYFLHLKIHHQNEIIYPCGYIFPQMSGWGERNSMRFDEISHLLTDIFNKESTKVSIIHRENEHSWKRFIPPKKYFAASYFLKI